MKKIGLVILFFSIGIANVTAQEYRIPVSPEGTREWGFSDINGNLVIEPEYLTFTGFSTDGSVLVNDESLFKFKLIDRNGQQIETDLEPIYLKKTNMYNFSLPPTFSDGCIVVTDKKNYGCMNSQGKLKIPIKYDQLTSFNGGYAIANLKKEYFVIDKAGEETLVQAQKIKEIKRFSSGLGQVEIKGKWGLIDIKGKLVVPAKFLSIGYFSSNGLAWAKDESGLVGFIDTKGNWVIQPKFLKARDFDSESDLAMVFIDDKWGYVDSSGEMHFFEQTEKTYVFSEGLAIGVKNGKHGFIDNNGDWVIEPKFDEVHKFTFGYAAMKVDGKWGLINKKGEVVIEPKFSNIYSDWIFEIK